MLIKREDNLYHSWLDQELTASEQVFYRPQPNLPPKDEQLEDLRTFLHSLCYRLGTSKVRRLPPDSNGNRELLITGLDSSWRV